MSLTVPLVAVPPVTPPPGGNVLLVDAPAVAGPVSGTEAQGFQLVDGEGHDVGGRWPTRADAVRSMGIVALHGVSLPLRVRGPDGRLTGDQLG